MSVAVKTPSTPGAERASSVSMAVIRPWAMIDLT